MFTTILDDLWDDWEELEARWDDFWAQLSRPITLTTLAPIPVPIVAHARVHRGVFTPQRIERYTYNVR